jgi:hypothetical protein
MLKGEHGSLHVDSLAVVDEEHPECPNQEHFST